MGPPGTESDWLTTEERGGSVVGANEDENGGSTVVAVGPPTVLQWVSASLAVNKSNPFSIMELVSRAGTAMNDTTVA